MRETGIHSLCALLNRFVIRNITLLVLILGSFEVSGSHGISMDFSYHWVDSGKYDVLIKGVHECSGLALSQSNLIGRSGNKIITLSTQTLISRTDISGIPTDCPNQSKCNGGTSPYGFEEFIWKVEVDLSSFTECVWTFSWEQCCRSSSITTGQSAENFFNYFILNKCVKNSSPVFEQHAMRYVCYLSDIVANQGVVDREESNDFFTYHLVAAKTDLNMNASYSGNFSPVRPLTFLGFPNQNLPSPAGFHLDSMTGAFQFRPTTLNQGGTICMEVREWRWINGVRTQIGTVRRDMSLFVINCTNKNPGIASVSRVWDVCIKDSFCFDIQSTDLDGDTTFIYWDSTLQGGQFYTTNSLEKHAKGSFCWKPLNNAVSETPYYFAISVYDDKCPLSGSYVTTFTIFVRDSTDGPSVDIGPDIVDSTGLDSFPVQGSLSDYSGQELLWTSTGDGEFLNPDTLSTYYYPGPNDKKACSYGLMLHILDPTPCLGNSKLIDTLEVGNVMVNLDAGPDASFFPSDTLSLNAFGDTGRAWTYQWQANGEAWIEDSSSLTTRILPNDSAVSECEFQLVLMAMACDTLYDTVLFSRAFAPINAGPDQSVLLADSIVLQASLQKGFWRSNGTGYFADTLAPNGVYYPDPSDYAACELEFIRQELPPAQCMVNSDTVKVSMVFTGLNAGTDQTIDLNDSALLVASPLLGPAPYGVWRSNGDGMFSDTANAQTYYAPGAGDKNNCEVALIWSYPYPACSQEVDTLILSFNYASAQAGIDQQILFGDTLYLNGSPSAPGADPNYWTVIGDGRLSDSLDPDGAYYPGPQDWENCGGALVFHAPFPQCGGGKDTMNWTRIPFVLQAGTDITTLSDSFMIQADPIQGGRVAGWWSTNGDGYFMDSTATITWYYPGTQELQSCEGVLLWNAPYSVCTPQKDSLKWQRTAVPVDAGPDQVLPIGSEIILRAQSTAKQVRWETNGFGSFLDSSARATVYYPSPLDYPLCSLNFEIHEVEQQCGLSTDDLNVVWQEEGISVEELVFDHCYIDSIEFVMKGNKDLTLEWTSNGTGTFLYDSSSARWIFLPSEDDLNQGSLTFYMDAKGYCLQTRDTLIFLLTHDVIHWKELVNGEGGPITVYPNPSTDWLTIDGNCPVNVVSVKLYDMLGQQLQNWKIQELPFVMSIESLAMGVYMLHIELKNGRIEKVPIAKYGY